jgi:hypothetical protein
MPLSKCRFWAWNGQAEREEEKRRRRRRRMIDCEAMKERIYYAMPAHRIQTNILAEQLNMQRNKVAFFLRLLRLDGRVEYLGRRYDPSVKTLRAFWRRK